MLFEYLMFWTRETLSNIGRNRLMSALAVSTVTIGLFILGAFFLALANVQTAADNLTQKLDLVVILEKDITPTRRKEIYNAAHIPQVADLQFVSKSQALKEMQRAMPKIPVSDLENDNPLGDELRIKLKNSQDIISVRNYLKSMNGVADTLSDVDLVRKLTAINHYLKIAGSVTLVVLGLAILLIIHNAIRLTIFARRREISIMELVGATSWFIRVPFLLEGILYGVLGAVAAVAVLSPLFTALARRLPEWLQPLLPLAQSDILWQCGGWMLLTGLIFGLAGSWISLSRSIGKAAHV
ncbi:MAG: permease-like cell division protein FtsX [Armatimonadota bacterium]|nr:permease-like cell division protein FtsX [Armatimonadota bacterium]